CVLHGHELLAAPLAIDLDPAQARKQIRCASMNDSAAIKLGENLHRKRQFSPGFLHHDGFRHCPYEIAAEADEGVHLSLYNAHARFYGIAALGSERLEAVLRGKLIERCKLGLLGNAYGSLALHV